MTIKVGGGAGAFPVLEPDAAYVLPGLNNGSPAAARSVCGFDMDGDAILLPTSYTGTMTYVDAAGNSVTSGDWVSGLTPADVDAAGATGFVGWVGFHLNDDGSLLYFVGLDTGSTLFLGTINKAGVINVIGSTTFSVGSNTAHRWPAASITRAPDGTGNIFVRFNETVGTVEHEINISTGATVTAEVEVANLNYCFWKTLSGAYTGQFSGTLFGSSASSGVAVPLSKNGGTVRQFIPYTSNIPVGYTAGINFLILHWRGRAVFAGGSNAIRLNAQAYTYAALSTFIDDLTTLAGIA